MSPTSKDNAFQSLSVIGPTHALNERLPGAHIATAVNPATKMIAYLDLEVGEPNFAQAKATVQADQAADNWRPDRMHESRI